MKSKFVLISGLAVASAMLGGPLAAHHGASLFENRTITAKGTVVEWFWANPHCLLKFDEKAENGEVRHWVVETQAPNYLLDVDTRWSKNAFKPGDQVTAYLRPTKDGRSTGALNRIVLADGTELSAVGKPGAAPAGGSGPGDNPKQ